ncbi:MAG: methionyl-tRNA formyltransferase [Ruminococcus sp.]|jgi:methionyl-tRNA formyltransferase|nr:methionyl-tRNA formyltransferase [Ruminococcus sp.]
MGTPEFAVPCLRELLRTEEVAAVFTKPDKPKGRGNKMQPSPVKVFAQSHNIPVYEPRSLKSGEDAEKAYELLKNIAPDLIIVAAYGQILPEWILELPALSPKCINLHGSLLPKYRGAAPIERAVMEGETETGITAMVMAKGVDTGDMLLTEKTLIGIDETAFELRQRLSEIAAKTMLKTLDILKSGSLKRDIQIETDATFAPMIDKGLSLINFSDLSDTVHNVIRAVSGYGFLDGKRLKLFRTHKTNIPVKDGKPGQLISDNGLYINCGDYRLQILELQPEGGKRIKADDFLRGHKITSESVLRREQNE